VKYIVAIRNKVDIIPCGLLYNDPKASLLIAMDSLSCEQLIEVDFLAAFGEVYNVLHRAAIILHTYYKKLLVAPASLLLFHNSLFCESLARAKKEHQDAHAFIFNNKKEVLLQLVSPLSRRLLVWSMMD